MWSGLRKAQPERHLEESFQKDSEARKYGLITSIRIVKPLWSRKRKPLCKPLPIAPVGRSTFQSVDIYDLKERQREKREVKDPEYREHSVRHSKAGRTWV